jgi:integrase
MEKPMTRMIHRLSATKVKTASEGMHCDGGGLYLQVAAGVDSPSRSWLFRYVINGRERQMGLGPVDIVSLSAARDKAAECRKLRYEGIDPLERRNASRADTALQKVKLMTFDQCAAAYIKAHAAGWRDDKSYQQWTNSLKAYASPVFGSLSVAAVDTGLVMKAIEPVWKATPETGSRLRGRIESILDWAKVRGHRSGENPARWKGHLEALLPARSKMAKVEHLASMPYAELPALMTELRQRDGIVPSALQFTILTAARSGETLGAKWSEVDVDAKTWTIPASRMKAGIEHRVPLTDAAINIVKRMRTISTSDYVFSGSSRATLSIASMLKMLSRMGRDITVHGFRSTFRTWAAEQTAFPSDVIEMSLAHSTGSKVELAYQRSDLFEKRRRLMDAWAAYCGLQQFASSPQ